jgi:small-conductance mechanosensitive channel
MKRKIRFGLWLVLWVCPVDLLAQASVVPVGGDSVATKKAMTSVTGFLTDLFSISTDNLDEKLARILIIIMIGVIAKFFMDALQIISRFLVYSEWGPLKFIFRNHKRSVTMHALFINVSKYVVYFTAFGYILAELGINYTTYLASLSLIGIAIGFGSQGLVQDVVTGFFILFENQFSVGDMVEISGQVGIVEDIGLRTTRLRNYFGAEVIFQNRNIPLVGRYRKGAFEFHIDVAIADLDNAERASVLLETVGVEFEKQFPEIIIGTPKVKGLVELETGEWFMRLYGLLWPAQQWVIDTQMVPRIREIFKREGIDIPADRVVAFYHLPGEDRQDNEVVKTIREMIGRATERTGLFGDEPDQA